MIDNNGYKVNDMFCLFQQSLFVDCNYCRVVDA
jgi:hypothetical protein